MYTTWSVTGRQVVNKGKLLPSLKCVIIIIIMRAGEVARAAFGLWLVFQVVETEDRISSNQSDRLILTDSSRVD